MTTSATPKRTLRWALRTVCCTAPVAILTPVAWFGGLLPAHKPYLVFMVYQLFVLVAIAGGAVAAVASGQLAIAKAFSAGYLSGQASAGSCDEVQRRGRERILRAVE